MTRADTSKGDRALELYEKGLTPSQIGERLGVRPNHVQALLQQARARREKAKRVPQWNPDKEIATTE